ncbi:MAG: ATP-binding protein, partial [Gemmiger sp.]
MDIKRAKEEIQNTVRAYLAVDENGLPRIPAIRQRPILLMGPPGVGKTQIMEQIARECGIALVAYTITHHTRQSAVGLPFIRQKVYEGAEHSVTEYTMSEIIASVYEKMEQTGLKNGILFIDEINCVSETLAPTMLQFLQCKTFGNQAVPAGWVIVAAGNPPEYNKSVREFDLVTLDRVRRIDVEPKLSVWQEYARAHRLHPAVTAYLELRPQHFYRIENDVDGLQFVTARGWEDLSALLQACDALALPVDEGVIGQYLRHPEVARDFAAYWVLYKKYHEDYGVEDILQGRPFDTVVERAMQASFDERISLVSLLLAGLNTRFAEARTADAVTDACYQFLRGYKRALTALAEGGDPAALLHMQCDACEQKLAADKAAGVLPPAEWVPRSRAAALLRGWAGRVEAYLEPDEAFDTVRAGFNAQVRAREQAVAAACDALESAFDFMERAFP